MEFMDYLRMGDYFTVFPDEDHPGSLAITRMYTGEPLLRTEFLDLVASLQRWYAAHTDAEIEALRDDLRQHEARRKAAMLQELHSNEKRPRAGVVYLMQSGEHYKIGCTTNLKQRRKCLSQSMPLGVKLIHEIATDDIEGLENYWHERFAQKRLNDEWFALTADDIQLFQQYQP